MTEHEDREAYDAFAGVEIELPDGKKVRCKAPSLEDSVRLLELLDRVQRADMEAMLEFVKEFPKAVNAGRAFNGLLPGELIRVCQRLFWQTDRMTTATKPIAATGAESS